MNYDYIEENKLTKSDQKIQQSKIEKLAKKFTNSQPDIELAQSVINQESAAAIKAYMELQKKRKERMLRCSDEPEIFHISGKHLSQLCN